LAAASDLTFEPGLGNSIGLTTSSDTLITLRVTSGNNIGLTVWNNGFIGTNFADRSPSLEYPLGSGQEHLTRAGLWVGGITVSADTLVSTASIDGYYGFFNVHEVSEFFPAASVIEERSILPNSRYYHPDAKSEQEFLFSYIDRNRHAGPEHTPLNVRVDVETQLFSFEPSDAIVRVDYRIINMNPVDPIYDLYVGLYGELASGWKDGHQDWPPRGWFAQQDIAYVDSLRLITEHNYDLDDGDCPSWGGYALLGTDFPPIDEATVSFNWWNWDPNYSLSGTPRNDQERYLLMSNGQIDATYGSEVPGNDPVTVLSVGPLGSATLIDSHGAAHRVFYPGDTVMVSFAWVGGKESPSEHPPRTAEEDIAYNTAWAHAWYSPFAMPPDLTLAILQNPYLTEYLDVYLVSTQRLDPGSISLEIDGNLRAMTLGDSLENVWRADYTLPELSDSTDIVVCASDFFWGTVCAEQVISATFVQVHLGGVACSPDGRVRLFLPTESLSRDGYILIFPAEPGSPGDMNLLPSAGSEQTGYSMHREPTERMCYTISPEGFLSQGTASLEFMYEAGEIPPGTDPRQLCIEQVGVGPLKSYVDPETRTVSAQISDFGNFRLRIGLPGSAIPVEPTFLSAEHPFPNPFRTSTAVSFELHARQELSFKVYDPAGREIACPFNGWLGPGTAQIHWNGMGTDGRRAACGPYFYRMSTDHRVVIGKLFLVR
jgi:hypothetical protein